jgi:NitT/TauT family transport system ATP-binding protein
MASAALEMVGLQRFEDKYPKALSGGMKMRASLARSLVLHPHLFLFDEPFASVDEITRARLNDEVIKLFTSEQFAAVFVTHSISEACFLSSRVVVMSQRPARILADIEIPFPYPRHQDLHYETAFVDKARQVAQLLGEA